MHGIDSYVLQPPLGALVSVLLLSGCDALGLLLLRGLGFCSQGSPLWHRWQAPVVGAALLTLVLYPLALVNLTPLIFMRAVGVLLGAMGFVNAVTLVRSGSDWRLPHVAGASVRVWVFLLIVLLVGAGLMSFAPPTDADSLDYHLGAPVAWLRHGGVAVAPEWLHSRLAASHEMLNAVGLAAGTDNFGAVLQFAGLAGIALLLVFADSDRRSASTALSERARLIGAVVALSMPMIVPLIAQKPQLLPGAMTSLAFALVIYPSRRTLTRGAALQNHALICLLAVSAAQAKLSFLLSGGVVGLLSLGVMTRRGWFWPAAGIGVAAALLLLPPILWRQHYFHDGFINSFVKSIPGDWPGSDAFDVHLRRFTLRSPIPFPLLLFYTSRLSNLTIVIGPAILILLTALRPHRDPWIWLGLAAVAVVSVVVAKFGPMLGRYYLEPCVWLLMLFAIQPQPPALIETRWFRWPLVAQAVLTAALFWFGAVSLFPGALTPRWRAAVMEKFANGYHVMQWVKAVLPPDAVLLSANRSIALAPRDVVSFDWAAVVDAGSRQAVPYLMRLKERGVTHVLMGTAPRYTALSGCVGPIVAGPEDDPMAKRNPFAAEPRFPVWLYRFNSEQLPDCAFVSR